MKKSLVGICILFISMSSVYALSNGFFVDYSKLSLTNNNKKNSVLDNFNKTYNLSSAVSSTSVEAEEEIIALSKKMTYLLLGDFNSKDESSSTYYKRHQDYLNMGAYQTFPRDKNSQSGYDETISNYRYASVSEYAVPSMFLIFNELGIQYNSYGDIRVTANDNLVISSVSLPKVKMKEENSEDPKKYNMVNTNLIITYYFLRIGDEYKLCYLYGETSEQINEYFSQLEDTESKATMQVTPAYDSQLSQIYDYSKLNAITDKEVDNIYRSNQKNIVILNSYYNNYSVASGNGFFINEGLIVTTWNFMEKSLINAQYIAIKDSEGNFYEIDGIVTANPSTDIVVIKLKNRIAQKVVLGTSKDLKVEDPVMVMSSKTGVGLTLQKGIIIANDSYIQSAVPLASTDEGSPLLDKNGSVVGMNTAKQINSSISMAVNSEILEEVQEKFRNLSFDSIEAISFDQLKEQLYYVHYNDEAVKNNISKSKWKEYSKIGNIEETIKLRLLKASYQGGVVSLRYQNSLSNYISAMQLAAPLKSQLIADGYTEIVSGNEKCIYKNNQYQVIIMEEFDYLIVVMVKL